MFLSEVEAILRSSPALGWLAGAATRSTLLLAFAGVLALVLRRRSAAARHLVWTLALAGCLAVPVLTAVVPRWSIALPAGWTAADQAPLAQAPPAPAFSLGEQPLAYRPPAEPLATGEQDARASLWSGAARAAGVRHQAASPARVVPGPGLLAFWLAGLALCALPVVLGGLSLWRLRRRARVLIGGPLNRVLDDLARESGIRRPVRLMLSAHRTMPMTWGLRRPVILLPDDAASWPAERLRAVLLHELAHVERGDCLVLWLAQAARAVHWFNPLAWLAVARVRFEQERACDELAIWRGLDPVDYAGHLLAITTGLAPRRAASAVAPAASRIERRLRAILAPLPIRGPLSRRRTLLTTTLALGLMACVASSRLTAAVPMPSSSAGFVHSAAPAETADPAADDPQDELLALIHKRYIRSVDERSLREGALKGMVESLHDPFSEYLPAAKLADFQRQIEGKLTGIGAQLALKEGRLQVISPLPGSPAHEAGLRPGDIILEVNGQPTKDVELGEIVKRIVGEAGTDVRLNVRHEDGREVEMKITRRAIAIPNVVGFRLDRDGTWIYELDSEHHVDYLQIIQFGKTTAADVRAVLQDRLGAGMKGLILDLRGSPGGMLEGAVDVAQLFLAEGTIVTTRGRDGEEHVFKADPEKALKDFPLVVLVNEQTASAAEILAGALKDHERAVLVGSRTFGKGTVQALLPLDAGQGAARLTVGKYLLPSGRSLDRHDGGETWGVDPNDGYFVPLNRKQSEVLEARKRDRGVLGGKPADRPSDQKPITPERLASEEADPQLAAALKSLLAKLDTGRFVKTGRSSEELAARMRRETQGQERRQELLKKLEELDKELDGLVRPGSAPPH